jgi:hypothetical protein
MQARSLPKSRLLIMRDKALAYSNGLGLTREERLGFSSMILRDRPPLATWKHLTEADLQRLLDAFEGHEKLNFLIVNGYDPEQTSR